MERVSLFCFAASYALSLGLDCLAMWQRLPLFKKWPQLPGWFRGGAWIMAAAGLVAHSLYLWTWQPSIAWQFGWLLVVAWFLAAFSVYEQAHRGRVSWSIFLLPMVLGMVGMATIIGPPPPEEGGLPNLFSMANLNFWNRLHGVLLLAASVVLSVAFIGSLMFLIRARQLKSKLAPGRGLSLFTLEGLETMNKRLVAVTFPLLSAGLGVGVGIMFAHASELDGFSDPKVLGALGLWLVFGVLLGLRYGTRFRGSVMAWMTVGVWLLFVVCLVLPHTLPTGPKASSRNPGVKAP